MAARVFSDYFSKVVIIESDPRLEMHGTRVGQRSQLHGFRGITLRVVERLFPGFQSDAESAGAV